MSVCPGINVYFTPHGLRIVERIVEIWDFTKYPYLPLIGKSRLLPCPEQEQDIKDSKHTARDATSSQFTISPSKKLLNLLCRIALLKV
jgi:hypothetical protein